MTLKDLKVAIIEMEKYYEYDEDTPLHVKDSSSNLKKLDGFFVGKNGRVFLG